MPMPHQHLWVKLFELFTLMHYMLAQTTTPVVLINNQNVPHAGDTIEANAIKSVFSDHATSGALALSSTKVNGAHDREILVALDLSTVISVCKEIFWHEILAP